MMKELLSHEEGCDGGQAAVLRILPFGLLNRRICGLAFGYAQISFRETSHVRQTLGEMLTSG